MKPVKGFETAQAYTDNIKLPLNAYIGGILDAEEVKYDWGSVLVLKFDICEGDYKNYYTEQYRNSQLEDKRYKGNFRLNIPKGDGTEQDEWTMRRFKTNILAIEDSNPGFRWDWDEKKLKNKKVGIVYQDMEWEFGGKTGFTAVPHSMKSVSDIRAGKFKIPAPKLLKNKAPSIDVEFTELDDTDDLPFD